MDNRGSLHLIPILVLLASCFFLYPPATAFLPCPDFCTNLRLVPQTQLRGPKLPRSYSHDYASCSPWHIDCREEKLSINKSRTLFGEKWDMGKTGTRINSSKIAVSESDKIPKHGMKILGICGGIGAGKSTACQIMVDSLGCVARIGKFACCFQCMIVEWFGSTSYYHYSFGLILVDGNISICCLA